MPIQFYSRRKKEEGRRKKEEGRRQKAEGRRQKGILVQSQKFFL
ncbi:hypothetical protein [Okeania sp. KiyG1]|nr:hypothetical protein [Okeania sp. KiyG1]